MSLIQYLICVGIGLVAGKSVINEDGYVTSTIEEHYKNGGKFKNIPKEDEFPVVIYFDYHSTGYDSLGWISIKGELK